MVNHFNKSTEFVTLNLEKELVGIENLADKSDHSQSQKSLSQHVGPHDFRHRFGASFTENRPSPFLSFAPDQK
jgi:hypothetical protein